MKDAFGVERTEISKIKVPKRVGSAYKKIFPPRQESAPWPAKMSDIKPGQGSALKMISNANRANGKTGAGWVIPEG